MAKCTEEGCPVLTNGVCLNGFADLKACSHYSETDETGDGSTEEGDSSDRGQAVGSNDEKSEGLHLKMYTGFSLYMEDVNEIALDSYTRLVMLAGMPDAGKTTALLSLMHLFETNRSYRGFRFAGSKTLADFEEKAWPSRLASNQEKGTTVRTNDIIPRFMHLQLAEVDSQGKKEDVLFTDVSGELFRGLKDYTQQARDFTLAERADHFALFLDADTLSDPAERHATKTAGLDILKSLSENGVLLPQTRIQIVFSRWDVFEAKADKDTHRAFIDGVKEEILAKYKDRYEITVHYIASRPSKSELEFGYGLGELFDLWMQKSRLDFNVYEAAEGGELEVMRNMSKYTFIN